MNHRLGILQLTALVCSLVGAAHAAAPRPAYPLYSPYFGVRHTFTETDLQILAENFDFVYGQTLTPAEMSTARRFSPDVKFLRYQGNWAVGAETAERDLRSRILYYLAAELAEDISPEATVLTVRAAGSGRSLLFKPSTAAGDISTDGAHFVTWLRVDDEFVRIDGWDSETKQLRVRRGFGGTAAVTHRQGTRLFHPAYGSVPGAPSGRINYLYDPAFADRWEQMLARLEEFTATGGDGIWIDILMASTLGDSDVGGTRLRGVNAESGPGDLFVWDFREQRPYRRDEFRRRTEQQLRVVQDAFRKRTGHLPLIYGNNMFYTEYTDAGGATWHYMVATPEKPEPVAGMCIEDYMGGYDAAMWDDYTKRGKVAPPPKASFGPHTYRNWPLNQGMLAEVAQRGLPAVPLIINAGMKTAIFEKLDRTTRHEWERWAYASYLLCVEIRDGRCVTKLGVPMFYHNNGVRHVDLDPMYRWPIGVPTQTLPAARFDGYKLPGTGIYARRFSGGLVLVNPGTTTERATLPTPLWNPDADETQTTLSLAPQSAAILLTAPLPRR